MSFLQHIGRYQSNFHIYGYQKLKIENHNYHFHIVIMLELGCSTCNQMIDISDLKAKYFIFESKFKIEETPSHLGTSMTSEDDNES